MASETPDVEFVKVDVDDADDVAAACGIQAMPTFNFSREAPRLMK
jgi:thioredoxin 1